MTLKAGDRVKIVDKCSPYNRMHYGKIGHVIATTRDEYDSNFSIPVKIEGEWNNSSMYGAFWFETKHLEIVKLPSMPSNTNSKNIKEENKVKEIKTLQILDLWKSNKDKNIDNMLKERRNEILEKDYEVATVRNHMDAIKEIANKYGYTEVKTLPEDFAVQFATESTKIALRELNKEFKDRYHRISVICEEIEAMLSACDTYEQEMDVLKAYGVVDEKGVLIKE